MPKKLLVEPGKCIGCSTCSLTCSITYNDHFDLSKAHIKIVRNDFLGTFEITFSSNCKGCLQCARVCPSGALAEVDLPEVENTRPSH